MKVMAVFGTRPEAIKMCPVIKAFRKQEGVTTIVCLSGQHKEMLSQVMNVFDIQADYNLQVMQDNQTLAVLSCKVIRGLDEILEKEKPDMLLVHGDTTTAFSAALTAFYRHIPIAHVEAGLRTYNMQSPYPEEFNRQAVDLISDLYFAPTDRAKEQLLREGKAQEKIYITGNTVIDALKTTVKDHFYNEDLKWVGNGRLLLLTAHRRENIGQSMENIFYAVKRIVEDFEDVKIIYPVHKNPKVREIAGKILGDNDRIRLIEPLDVLDFHNYMKRSYLILTDSGGIQEEAPSLGKPVLVLRDTTERPEGVEAGTLRVVGTDEEQIYKNTKELLSDERLYMKMSSAVNPYGDGHASERIVKIVMEYIGRN